jgi:carboxymethylenebutenolidase
MTIENRDLKLEANGKPFSAFLAQPAEGGGPGVLVLHAWWGMKPFIKQLCDRLAAAGFTALAPDLFQGRTAATIAEAESMLGQHDKDLMADVIQASLQHLRSLTMGKLGVIGFSYGAARALVAAADAPDVAGVVLFYGAYSVDFKQVKARVQGHFAETDEYEPLEGVREMQSEMQTAGLDMSMHVYPETSHWFMEEDRPEFDKANAELAWQRTIDFLKEILGQQVSSA